jgi:hypothetical protein
MWLTLFNGLLGAICGIWFRVPILVPLIAFAFVEVAVLKHTETWLSVFWIAIILIVAIEIGYMVGSSVATLWVSSGRRWIPGEIGSYRHKRLWSR